ncbi:MAG: hypothetical protein EOM13_06840 [Clostridia bacterium]|nr:hypothetical protein [Clostridia bacterium]
MLEKPYAFAGGEEKTIEQVIDRDEVMINHMILPRGAALPQHNANSNVFMTVVRGQVTLQLDDQPPHCYEAGQIIEIPFRTLMNVSNQDEAVLELFVIKAPGPRTMNNLV